ncbi:MAG: hypothetical protein F4171_17960 [Gammaproteobacteria bacterium]|nr:hypothetical protein [Gammaproteobacteria bacterium]
MKILKVLGALLVVLVLGVAVAAPIGPMPGFFIGGEQAQPPETWPDTSSVHEVKLKVPGGLPRVVIIWIVDVAGDLYVVGDRSGGWVRKIGAASPVELRIGDSTFALSAVAVSEGAEAILTAWLDKYEPDYPEIVAGFRNDAAGADSAAVFRLERE